MYIVSIQKTSTGEVREYIERDHDWSDLDEYMWTDGNYGCDCNRALFFARAADEDETEAWEQPCGDDLAYKMLRVVGGDGAELWATVGGRG